jgi:DNA-binding NtrC family response regulator
MTTPTRLSRTDETAALSRRPPMPIGVVIRPIAVRASAPELHLATGSCVIGAGAGADLIIDDKTVSRRHVELSLVPEGVVVRDLDSRNGTFYLGQRIEKMVLSPGSRLRLGSVELAIAADLAALADSESDATSYRALTGASAAMRRLFALLARLEGSLVPVLIEGESGVGKELCARAIHRGSSIAAGPMVVVNCGAIARELVLSELFGHKKGAFTGATDARVGAFAAADGGTLFLDEIGELPLDVQPALLRALESGEIKSLGDNETKQVKVRVVAATNRDLESEVARGGFREDLYYRLAVIKLRVPPLRERLEDIPLLAAHFAREAGAGELPADVLEAFAARPWKGNARELKNAVLAFIVLGTLSDDAGAPPGLVEAALRQAIDASQPYQDQKEAFLELFSRVYFSSVLSRTGGNQSEAARLSGVERSYLGKLLTKYGVKP